MNALIYAPSGGGKTVNATRVKVGERGRNLLVCTDNSSVVLSNFDRPNLDIVNVSSVQEFLDEYRKGYESKKYDNIILDNISDFFDMYILELEASGKYKDMRQAFLVVYQNLKRLSRESAFCGSNTIFTAWSDLIEIPQPDGSRKNRLQPKLPMKILDNFAGLVNILGYVSSGPDKDGNMKWWYTTKGSPEIMAKDQVRCRDFIMPEDLFV
jgi:phage nucleotide-binding protein